MHRFHLGVDYGTSASKLVLRHFEAPGGEKAYLLEPDGTFRIPSGVHFDGKKILLNTDTEGCFKSLKMRYAGEVKENLVDYYFGHLSEIPFGFSSRDLVILCVWKLISIGHLAATKLLGNNDFKMGMTLGVPMSFLEDGKLRNEYLGIARMAYHTYINSGPIGPCAINVDLAREILIESENAVRIKAPVPESNLRNWIRSETEASMYSSFKSPATPISPYFCVDVGAGTTDSSAFLIRDEVSNGQREKDSLTFFGAYSHPFAMDAIRVGQNQKDGYQKIRRGLECAARQAYSRIKDNHYSVNQWRRPRLIVLGGGALNPDLIDELHLHPMVNFNGDTLERLEFKVPDDLVRVDDSNVKEKDVVFTSVAYGLAQLAEAVPVAERPSEVQRVQGLKVGKIPNHNDLYGD